MDKPKKKQILDGYLVRNDQYLVQQPHMPKYLNFSIWTSLSDFDIIDRISIMPIFLALL